MLAPMNVLVLYECVGIVHTKLILKQEVEPGMADVCPSMVHWLWFGCEYHNVHVAQVSQTTATQDKRQKRHLSQTMARGSNEGWVATPDSLLQTPRIRKPNEGERSIATFKHKLQWYSHVHSYGIPNGAIVLPTWTYPLSVPRKSVQNECHVSSSLHLHQPRSLEHFYETTVSLETSVLGSPYNVVHR